MRRLVKQAPWLVGLVALALVAPACGGDEEGDVLPPPNPNAGARRTGGAAPAAGAPGAKGAPAGLTPYQKLEEVVPADEAEEIRRPFQPRDFAADITGNDNRDPFRSYVVRQTITAADAQPGGVTVATTEICTERNMVAPDPMSKDPRARKSYSLRDLRLAGIVMRGTRGYAIFRDSSGYGHLVRKGDCLGKEKARVTTIGAHIVKVEVVPEPGPNQLAQEPQERKFELYKDEIPLDDEVLEGNSEEDSE
jgi:Tfp pilus assembly protein PilP